MTTLSAVISIFVGLTIIIGSIFGAAHWIAARTTKAMDERVNEQLIEHLKPILAMLKSLDGEPGDESKGIPDRAGILQRQTITERRVSDVFQKIGAIEHEISGLRGLIDTIMTSLTTNNGGSTVLDKLEKLQRTAENGGPLTA